MKKYEVIYYYDPYDTDPHSNVVVASFNTEMEAVNYLKNILDDDWDYSVVTYTDEGESYAVYEGQTLTEWKD